MTIAETDREIRELIQKHHVYGAEAVINALVRAAATEPYLTNYEILKILNNALERESTKEVTA